MNDKGDRNEERAEIPNRLGSLYTKTLQPQRKQQHRRQEENTLPAACQEGSLALKTQALIKLIDIGTESQKGQKWLLVS